MLIYGLTVERNTTSIERLEQRDKLPVPEEKKASATRITVSNPEIVYPFLNHLENFDVAEPLPPTVVPYVDSNQPEKETAGETFPEVMIPYDISLNAAASSFRGTQMHTAQTLSLVFSRHRALDAPEQLRAHFPTFSRAGLEVLFKVGETGNNSFGSERLKRIYKTYLEMQEPLIETDDRMSRATLHSLWTKQENYQRAMRFIDNIHYLFSRGMLKVSDPSTIMQFEVALIPLFRDLQLQVPMSIDMFVKQQGQAPYIVDLKVGQTPNLGSEVSLHQRYLMEAAARLYIPYLQGQEPLYFGDPILFTKKDVTAEPYRWSSLQFLYSSDMYMTKQRRFKAVQATIDDRERILTYYGLQTRAQQINENKKRVRALINFYKNISLVKPSRSIFHPKKHKDDDPTEPAKSDTLDGTTDELFQVA